MPYLAQRFRQLLEGRNFTENQLIIQDREYGGIVGCI